MAYPNLFLIGAQKGGSSSLAHHLAEHPEIQFFHNKEPNIFNQPTLQACKALLRTKTPVTPTARYTLDGSVNYSSFPQYASVPDHILQLCDPHKIKFIYIMRNPADRAISHYFWQRERYGEYRTVLDAIVPNSQYVLSSKYDVQIQHYLRLFDPTQFYFVKFDDYYMDVAGSYAALCRWLDIDDSLVPDTNRRRGATDKKRTRAARWPAINALARSNATLRQMVKAVLPHKYQIKLTRVLSRDVDRPDISAQEYAQIKNLFHDSVIQSEKLTGLDLSDWL